MRPDPSFQQPACKPSKGEEFDRPLSLRREACSLFAILPTLQAAVPGQSVRRRLSKVRWCLGRPAGIPSLRACQQRERRVGR